MHGKLIANRRRVENAYKDMDMSIQTTKKIYQMADFENKTTAKIENKMKMQEVERRKQSYEANLHERRQKLADLYNDEIEMWREEVLAKVETQEDRKKRIMERAYALRDAREKERLQVVKEKLDQQWREACDDARTLDSKAMTKYMNDQRLQQIRDKMARKEKLSAQENFFLDEWNRQLEEVARRDQEKLANKRRVARETSAAIRAQMEENMRRKEQEYERQMKEDEEELNKLRADIESEELNMRKKKEGAYERGRENYEFNLQTKMMRDEESKVDKYHDAILLDYALRKEQEANAAEEEKRNADKEAAMKYRKYLEEQMIKEAEDTAFVDEIRKREEERLWKARDDALLARQHARDRLMHMVDEGRQEQIKAKKEFLELEKVEGQKFASKFLSDASAAVRQEKEQMQQRRQQNVENNHRLQQQIDYRRQKEEFEKQEAYLADKHMKHMERLHQQKLAEQGGVVRVNRPLMKNNWGYT